MADDQTVRFGSVRYSTPPGHAGTRVWCRVAGEELVITARTSRGAAEIARHRLSAPGSPSCLMRWAQRKYKRLQPFRKARRWWQDLIARQPHLFADWAWTNDFSPGYG